MKLTIVKSEWIDDWYVIERAEHDGREWLERTGPNSASLQCSSRISDADIEGTMGEMLAIAEAIHNRESISFKRCAVEMRSDGAAFCSPRNSQRDGVCSLDDADDLAGKIKAMCATQQQEE